MASIRFLPPLFVGLLVTVVLAEETFDYTQPQSPLKPAPDWVTIIDQGKNNPELAGYFTPEGIKVEIVAREPVIVNPTAITFGDDGRLFALEWTKADRSGQEDYEVTFRDGSTATIHRMAKPTRDLLKVIEDQDSDGLYDTSRVLMDDLEIPSSMLLRDDWVYLSSIGHVIRRRPSRPGGPYDVEEEILRGLCGYHHHQASGMTIGNAGWLYVSSGDDDNRAEGPDGSRAIVLRTGAIVRCRPDGRHLSTFALGFRNPYRDVAFDEAFNMFHVDNDNEDGSKFTGCRLMHVVEGGDYGWRLLEGAVCCQPDHQRGAVAGERPGTLPAMLKTGRGSPAGLLIYNGTRFPEHYRGLLIYPDVYRKLVRAYVVRPRGATFEVTHEFELMKSQDDRFRPCQAIVGPDGAIYIADWRTDSGGAGRLWGDGVHGRIYRLSWGGTDDVPAIPLEPIDSWQKIRDASSEQLVELLSDADFEKRKRAQQELVRRGPGHRQTFLELLGDSKKPLHARLHALGGAQSFWDDEVKAALCAALRDPYPDVRRLAADALSLNSQPGDAEAIAALRAQLVRETLRAVKRQLALAYARLAGGEGAQLLVDTLRLDETGDVYYHDGLVRAVERMGEVGLTKLKALALSPNQENREFAVSNLEAMRTRQASETVAEIVAAAEHLSDDERARVFRTFKRFQFEPPISAEPIADWLLAHPDSADSVKLAGLETLALVGGVEREKTRQLSLGLLEDADSDVRRSAIAAVRSARITEAAGTLAQSLTDSDRSLDERKEALEALAELREKSVVPTLRGLVEDKATGSLKSDVLRTLAAIDEQQASGLAEGLLSDEDSQLVAAAINVLGSRAEGARLVGERFLSGAIPRAMLPRVSEAIRRHAEDDPEMSELLSQVMRGGLLLSTDPAETERIATLVREQGNPQRGRGVFLDGQKLRCISCHKLEGVGGSVGPDLSKIWETHSVAKVLESMLDPSKEIKEGFQTWTVVTREGLVHSGLKISDTDEEVVLRDSDGHDIHVSADEIDEKRATDKSLMPDNVVALLSYDEFVDLVAFLKERSAQEGLRQMALEWWTVGPFPGDPVVEFPPEKDPDPSTAVSLPDGTRVQWQSAFAGRDGYLDFRPAYGDGEIAVYGLCFLHSPEEQEVTLRFGSADKAKLWVNGELVHRHTGRRAPKADEDSVTVTLQEGPNQVLVKIVSARAEHGLFLRVEGARSTRFSRSPEAATVAAAER